MHHVCAHFSLSSIRYKQASCHYPHTGKLRPLLIKKKKKNYTKAASFLQRKLQQSLLSELVSTHTEAQTQLAASWEERQADTICVEKGLGHGGREASEK